MTKKIFLARPSYGPTEPESDRAAHYAVNDQDKYEVISYQFKLSMTSKNCNDLLCACLNRGDCDYFAMLHADNAPEDGWAQTLIERMEEHGYDVIHAPVPFKNDSGYTSTSIRYDNNHWHRNRFITLSELRQLPETFDVETLKECYDPDADAMLLNTGTMVVKLGPWIENFPGFTMYDRIFKHEGRWHAISVSEDYQFGHWLANNGLKVGATKLTVGHVGRFVYSTADTWGLDRDETYFESLEAAKAVEV